MNLCGKYKFLFSYLIFLRNKNDKVSQFCYKMNLCMQSIINLQQTYILGFLLDPDKVPGIAHFCEHMLFLGTEKVSC